MPLLKLQAPNLGRIQIICLVFRNLAVSGVSSESGMLSLIDLLLSGIDDAPMFSSWPPFTPSPCRALLSHQHKVIVGLQGQI